MTPQDVNRVRAWLKSRWQVVVPNDWLEACLEWIHSENQGTALNPSSVNQMVYDQWLLSDLHELGSKCLPENLVQQDKVLLNGSFCMQIDSVIDVSTPYYAQLQKVQGTENANVHVSATQPSTQTWEPKAGRMLMLSLTDGVQDIQGMEYRPIPCLNTQISPGSKVLVRGEVLCRLGVLMLTASNISLLGGEVDTLVESNTQEALLRHNLEQNSQQNEGRLQVQRKEFSAVPPTAGSRVNGNIQNTTAGQQRASTATCNTALNQQTAPPAGTAVLQEWDEEDEMMAAMDPAELVAMEQWEDDDRAFDELMDQIDESVLWSHQNFQHHQQHSQQPPAPCENSVSRRPNPPAQPAHRPAPPSATSQPANRPAPPSATSQPANRPAPPSATSQPANRPAPPSATSQPANRPAPPTATSQPANRPAPPSATSQPNKTGAGFHSGSFLSKPKPSVGINEPEMIAARSLLPGHDQPVSQGDSVPSLRPPMSTVRAPAANTLKTDFDNQVKASNITSQKRLNSKLTLESSDSLRNNAKRIRLERSCEDSFPRETIISPEVSKDTGSGSRCTTTPWDGSLQHIGLDTPPYTYLIKVQAAWPPKEVQTVRIKAYVATLLDTLKHNDGSHWALPVKVNDGTASQDVDLSDEMLTSLIGFTAQECMRLRAAAKLDKQARARLTGGIKQCQDRLIQMAVILELRLDPDSERPLVLSHRPATADDWRGLQHRNATL